MLEHWQESPDVTGAGGGVAGDEERSGVGRGVHLATVRSMGWIARVI